MQIGDRPCTALLAGATLITAMTLGPAGRETPFAYAAQPVAAQLRPDAAERVDTFFTAQERAHLFSGTVLVAQGDRVLLSKGYGPADAGRQLHNTSDTQFEAPLDANMEFAVAALLQFEQAGKLRDSARICTFIRQCPSAWTPITVHQLLNFTSGISDYLNESQIAISSGQNLTQAELIREIELLPMDFRPGTSCCSWTSSPIVAEYLVEQISGESFGAYLQQHFFGPLGLRHSGYYAHYAPNLLRLAVGYQSWQKPAPAVDESYLGGIIYSTVADFYRWQYALLSGHLLSSAATARMLTPAYTFCPRPCSPSLSFPPGLPLSHISSEAATAGFQFQQTTLQDLNYVELTTGDAEDFGDHLEYWPAPKVTVIIFTNFANNDWVHSIATLPLLFN